MLRIIPVITTITPTWSFIRQPSLLQEATNELPEFICKVDLYAIEMPFCRNLVEYYTCIYFNLTQFVGLIMFTFFRSCRVRSVNQVVSKFDKKN